MTAKGRRPAKETKLSFLLFASAILVLPVLIGCSPSAVAFATIPVVEDLDMVRVAIADPLYGQTRDAPWKHGKSIINLVADFMASFPGE